MALPRSERGAIIRAVDGLGETPLAGALLSGEWQGLRRLRVGSYRVIYTFDGTTVTVAILRIGHRRDVYR
jgi:mRNA interferase RelE/StbE